MTSMQIGIFLAVAETLSFSKTAEIFFTTQPTVSRQIKMLEDEWGILLFKRNRREVRLTEEGKIMAKVCEKNRKAIQTALYSLKNPNGEEVK